MKENYWIAIASIVLVIFFLFQSGLLYEITADPVPSSITLSKSKMEDSHLLIHETDAFSAIWLSNYGDVEHIETVADTSNVEHVLSSYSTINPYMMFLLANQTEPLRFPGAIKNPTFDKANVVPNVYYIYLGRYNLVTGMALMSWSIPVLYDINQLPIFNTTGTLSNRIFSNGPSEIYYQTASTS